MTVKRVNVTLEDDIHEAATAYAEGKGWSFSGMVTKALREMMDRGDSSPSSGQAVLSAGAMEEMISQRVDAALKEYLTPDRLVSMLPAASVSHGEALTEVSDMGRTAHRSPRAASPGSVTVTDEFKERLLRFGPTDIQNASGVNKGSVSTIQRGEQLTMTRKTFEKLEAGISALEAEAAKNTLIPSE